VPGDILGTGLTLLTMWSILRTVPATGEHSPLGGAATDPAGTIVVVPFDAVLVRCSGPSPWVFAAVPVEHAPGAAGSFGRVPVVATVDGRTWPTSVWRGKDGTWQLAVPARVRGKKDDGDTVSVSIEVDASRL
jgi:hypothetical protein